MTEIGNLASVGECLSRRYGGYEVAVSVATDDVFIKNGPPPTKGAWVKRRPYGKFSFRVRRAIPITNPATKQDEPPFEIKASFPTCSIVEPGLWVGCEIDEEVDAKSCSDICQTLEKKWARAETEAKAFLRALGGDEPAAFAAFRRLQKR